MSSDLAIIIPARYDSKRLPGKLLKKVAGKFVIEYTIDLAKEYGRGKVYVATPDALIEKCLSSIVDVIRTEETFCGTDCCALANKQVKSDFCINLQGDTAMANPFWLGILEFYLRRSPYEYHTLGWTSRDKPIVKDGVFTREYLNHIGVYGFSSENLDKFHKTRANKTKEDLEQTRIPFWSVHEVPCNFNYFSVDSPADLEKFKALKERRSYVY